MEENYPTVSLSIIKQTKSGLGSKSSL